MRIMQIVSGTGVNGAVLQCRLLTSALAARGHEITLVSRPGSWSSNQPRMTGVRVVRSELRRWPLDDLRNMADLVRREHIDVIHTHQSRAHFFGVLLRWLAKTPCVATAHARHLQPYWRFNDFVMANSEATYRFQHRWNFVPESRMRVVHYLLDVKRFDYTDAGEIERIRRSWHPDEHALFAGIVGDVIPRKGHVYAVRAMPRVLESLPQAKLVIIGEEKHRRYVRWVRAEAARLGVADHILWVGYRTDIPAVMLAIDVCVSAAREEALGLTIPEAMAAGRAVVATNVGGVPENVRHGETGLLVPPADPAALADSLVRILSDRPWRLACGQRGRQLLTETYNVQRQLEQLEAIYDHVARTARQKTRAA